MSLACFECNQIGSFDTLVLFDPKGKFDCDSPVSSFPNFYTCCASISDFTEAKDSRFLIVKTRSREGSWLTGTDGDPVGDTRVKRINEAELRTRMPRIFEALMRTNRE